MQSHLLDELSMSIMYVEMSLSDGLSLSLDLPTFLLGLLMLFQLLFFLFLNLTLKCKLVCMRTISVL